MQVLLPFELSAVVNEMHEAKSAGLYYPCLLVALTLPEICCGLALQRDQFVKKDHYVRFIDTFSSPKELGDDGLGIYRLRGGLVHRGDLRGHANYDATHVIFSLPESRQVIHALSIESGGKRAAMFDLGSFVNGMDTAVRRWYLEHKENSQVKENLAHLIRYSPDGVSPFVQGMAAIVSGR